jgi:hypothetical protein
LANELNKQFSAEAQMSNKYMKRMLTIFSHQGSANHNHLEIPSHSSRNGCHQNNNNVDKNVQKWNPDSKLVGVKLGEPLWKSVWRFLQKFKTEFLYDPSTQVLAIHPKE